MFSKGKKEVIGTFEDEKGCIYRLVKKSQNRWFAKKDESEEEYLLYRDTEVIAPWNATKTKLILSKSKVEEVNHFVQDYLQYPEYITASLQYMQFPMESLLLIWNGGYKDNRFLKETLLVTQHVFSSTPFIEGLTYQGKWLVLTQNIHRSREVMVTYEKMYQDVIVYFLYTYLSKEYVAKKHEEVYGEWKSLIMKTFHDFYTDEFQSHCIQLAMAKGKTDIENIQIELIDIQKETEELDKKYEEATFSHRLKIQERVKVLLKKEKEKSEELQGIVEKTSRIQSFLQTD